MTSSRGFTLLELLIGMTLLGFILALLFGGFRLASNSWDAVELRTEQTADAVLGRNLVRRLLTQMQPKRWRKTLNIPIAFFGDHQVLRAIAPVTGQSGASGPRVVELAVEAEETTANEAGGVRLVLRQAPIRYDAQQFSDSLVDATSHVILSHLEVVEFSYFGPEKRGALPQWQDVWVNPDQLPFLIKVHLASRDAGWTDLIVAPMINGSGACLWDNFYKRCRPGQSPV